MTEIKATYSLIQGYKYSTTNHYLALSEFIDNSISSYLENNGNDIDGLIIKIEFNEEDKDDVKIIISDNAGGMDSKGLEKAMQPNDRTGKGDNKYNQYGVGMKLGIFYHGANCTIYSKKKKEKEYKLELFTFDKEKFNQNVEVNAEKSNDNAIHYDSGTTIIISKVYNENNINRNPLRKPKQFEIIKDALCWRYGRLIKRGLQIKLIARSYEEKNNKEEIIRQFNKIKPFKASQLFVVSKKSSKKDSQLTIEQKRAKYQECLISLKSDILKKNVEKKSEVDFELLQEAFDKLENNEDVFFEKEIEVNNKKTIIKFGIIDNTLKPLAEWSGLSIYHLDRAIIHGPNDRSVDLNDKKSTMTFINSKINEIIARYRHYYGELDLTDIENPDQNKSSFLWSLHGEEDVTKFLEKVFWSLKPIVEIIIKINDITSSSKQTSDSNKKVTKGLGEKLRNLTFESIEDGNEIYTKTETNIFGGKCTIRIFEDNKCDRDFITTRVTRDDENNKKILDITIKTEHLFWKPLIAKDENKSEIIYPVALIIGISQIIVDDQNTRDAYNPNKSKKYTEIIQDIMNDWMK